METPKTDTQTVSQTEQEEDKPKAGGWSERAANVAKKAQQHYRATKALASVMKEAWTNQRELRILVTGKTGQGKSALINGILGATVAVEGARATRCTTEVEMYAKTIEGVPIKVFDSPGLQDRTDNEGEYIKGMREQCQELSLVLYCTKMINTRLTDADKNAMIKLTEAFGESFWDYAVFVLTFANKEDVSRQDERDAEEEEPDDDDEEGWKELEKRRFRGRLEIWKEDLQQFLKTEVKVSTHIVENIPVVPTGDRKVTRSNKEPLRLPDRDNWFINYWEVCCLRVKNTRLFMKVNSNRIVSADCRKQSIRPVQTYEEEEEEEPSPHERIAAMKEFIGIKVMELPDDLELQQDDLAEQNANADNGKSTDSEATSHSPSFSKRLRIIESSSSTYSLEDSGRERKLQDDLIIDQSICIHSQLVSDVTAETVRRAGFDESFVKGAKTIVEKMKEPVQWFFDLFRIRKLETSMALEQPSQ